MPKKMSELSSKLGKTASDMPIKALCSVKVQEDLRNTLSDTYRQLSEDLIAAHKAYRTKETKMEKDRLIHGSITEQKQLEFDNAKKLFEKLLSIVTTLSECIGQDMPSLEIEKEEEEGGTGLTVWEAGRDGSGGADEAGGTAGAGGLFGDPETRAFYEELPDLLSAVPLTILGFSPEQAATMKEQWAAEVEQWQQSAYSDGSQSAQPGDQGDSGQTESVGRENSARAILESFEDLSVDVDEKMGEEDPAAVAKGDAQEPEEPVDESRAAKLLDLLNEKLPECINKQRADEFCVSFCYIATKNARKRLAQALARVPKFRSELTVTYARITASLTRVYPEIGPWVLDALKREFFGMLKTKHQQHVDGKSRNVRYLGELVKFRVAPPIVAFRMFRTIFGDFSNQNAQLLSVLLETCGRFLYLLPYTHKTMGEMLNTMLRLRRAKNLDLNMQTLLEAAYFAVKPPERVAKSTKAPRSLVQQYARYLIQVKLEEPRASIEGIIRSLRRLPWKDPAENIVLHVIKASMKVARSKYVSIPNLADCLSGIGSYHPNLIVVVVDRILEEVQRSIETPYKREVQRVLGLVRLLGELYNFTAISSVIIFDLLYHLIEFGHSEVNISAALIERATQACTSAGTGVSLTSSNSNSSNGVGLGVNTSVLHPRIHYDPRVSTEIDPPGDLFRAQVVCELLNTTGMYFIKGKPKEKLTRFLVYFQRYLLTKQFIPLHVEFTILDTLDMLEELAKEAENEGRRGSKPVGRGTSKLLATNASAGSEGPIFARFETFEAAQAAVEVYEQVPEEERARLEREQECEAEEELQARDEEGDDADEGEDGSGEESGDSDDSSSDGSGDSSESDSESDSDDDDEDEDNDDEDDEDEEERERREENERSEALAAKMMEKLRIAEEDEEFEKAFKSVMQESVHHISSKTSNDVNRMVIPAVLPKPKNAFRSSMSTGEGDEEDEEESGFNGGGDGGPGGSGSGSGKNRPAVVFKLLSRDTKGRFETRSLSVPQDNKMAVHLAKAEEAQRAEKQLLKARVLQINQLAAEAEAAEERMQSLRGGVVPISTAAAGAGGGGGGGGHRGVAAGGRSHASSAGGEAYTAGGGGGGGHMGGTSSGNARQVQGNPSGVSYGGYGRVSYASAPGGGQSLSSGRVKAVVVRGDEPRRPDTLNLDEFLAETNASDLRKLSSKKNGKL